MVKNLFKITIILLLVIVNSVQAQVKPTTTIYALILLHLYRACPDSLRGWGEVKNNSLCFYVLLLHLYLHFKKWQIQLQ